MLAKSTELTRRDRNKLRNQSEILEAALAVFAEKGYQQASVQEIADRADFAVSTIYALFENKEDLYRQVSAEVGRECGEIFDEAMARGKDEYEKLVNFARAKVDVGRVSPDGIRMLENERHEYLAGSADLPAHGIRPIYDRFMLRIQDLFASGIAKGLFVDKPPALLALSLDTMTTALLKMARTQPDTYSYEDGVEEVIEIFFGPVLIKPDANGRKGRRANAAV